MSKKEIYPIMIKENPERGFNFPFGILLPENLRENPELIFSWSLPLGGKHGGIIKTHPTYEVLLDASIKGMGSDIDYTMAHLYESGNPMIMPIIPKFDGYRPNFLGSNSYHNDFSKYEGKWFYNYLDKYVDLADQVKNMIDYAVEYLRGMNINVPDKVIMNGYSEGSKGTSHFALLHPEVLKAVIVGGTAGLMPVPLKELEGYKLNFPVGINDIPDFDYDTYKQIKFFYYMGVDDRSDPALPNFEEYHYKNEKGEDCVLTDECGNLAPYLDENGNAEFILDENGNYTGKYDLFTDDEVNTLNKIYGTKCLERFKKQEKIFNELGLDVECHLYPGNHRTIFENRKQIFSDIDCFLGMNNKQLK